MATFNYVNGIKKEFSCIAALVVAANKGSWAVIADGGKFYVVCHHANGALYIDVVSDSYQRAIKNAWVIKMGYVQV